MKKVKTYPDELKNKIIQQVLSGQLTKNEAQRKYGIGGNSLILKWIRQFQATDPNFQLMSQEKQLTIEQLQQQIEVLKKELAYEKLKSNAFDTMIEVAERELNIAIRKKYGTKACKK